MGNGDKTIEDPEPTKDQFAALFESELKRQGHGGPFSYDADSFCILAGGLTFSLRNGYREYLKARPQNRKAILEHFAGVFGPQRNKMPESLDEARPNLVPQLRTRSWFAMAELLERIHRTSDLHGGQAFQILADHLALGIAYDFPDAVATFGTVTLEVWGVSFHEAMEIAKENLATRPPAVTKVVKPGTFVVCAGDSHDASRMILLDRLAGTRIRGNIIAMPKSRDKLIVTGSEDQEGLEFMADFASQEPKVRERLVSNFAFEFRDGDWHPWLPAADNPLARTFRELRIQEMGSDYHEQKVLLDRLHAKLGKELHVAGYQAVRRSDGGDLLTCCAWSLNTVMLLPRTDYIAIGASTSNRTAPWELLGFAKWECVAAEFPSFLEEQDDYPPRYLVYGAPDEGRLRALCSRTIE